MRSPHSIVRLLAYGGVWPLVSLWVLAASAGAVPGPRRVARAAAEQAGMTLFDCRPAFESGYTVPHERLLWVLPPDQAEDSRFPSYQPHAREAGVVELHFAKKLESSVVLNCGGTSTEWIERVVLQGRTAEVRLRGVGTRWRVDLEERALIVWSPRAIAQAVSRRWPTPSARTLLSEARQLGMAPNDIDDLERRLDAVERRPQGFAAFAAGRFEEAVGHLQSAFEAVPNDVESGLALARARYQLGHYDLTEELLESLAAAAPRSAEIRHEQGLLALSRDRGRGAHPDRANRDRNSRDDARQHFQAAAEGGWPNAPFYLGFLAFQDGDDAAATAALDRFLTHNPDALLITRAQRMLAVLADRKAQAQRPSAQERGSAASATSMPATSMPATSTKARNSDRASTRNPQQPGGVAGPPLFGPSLVLRGFGRDDLQLASLGGRPLVLHLWATWCPPCRKEMPSLMRFVRDRLPGLEAAGLSLITVSMDYTEDELADVASVWADEIDGDLPPIYWDPNWLLAERLGLGSALPQTVLVAADGSVRTVLVGAQDWNNETFEAQLHTLAASADN